MAAADHSRTPRIVFSCSDMAKEGKKHKADKGDKGAKGDHKKPKEGKGGKKHSTSEHKRKHSKGKTPPSSSGDESRTSPGSSGEDPLCGVQTSGSEMSGSEPDTSDVEAGLSGKRSEKSVMVKTPTDDKQTSDGAKDVHPVGRFCLLLGSFALMAAMIYLVMQVYQWVGRSEKIFGENHFPEVDASNNPAAATMEKAYKL